MTERTHPDALKGALAGMAAGLIAAAAMNGVQAALSALSSSEGGEPATEKTADRIATATTGRPVPPDRKPQAGQAVHYALGAALGVAYGVAAEFRPEVTAGLGTVFGTGTALLLDEAAVPAFGLGSAPTKTPPATHLYTLVSHLVFGLAAEGTRRLARRTLA